jgi:hypothetical protein
MYMGGWKEIKSNQIVYSDSCRVALSVTLITGQSLAAGGTIFGSRSHLQIGFRS